jgi:hypothetical protein
MARAQNPPRSAPHFWIGSAARDHVLQGVAGGFCQLSHGRPQPLERMHRGDWIAYYSGRESWDSNDPCHRFTALAKIVGEAAYQVTVSAEFHPYRREAHFYRVREIEIRPLVSDLAFIGNKQYWGLPFRRGVFQVDEPDFQRIASAMLRRGFPPSR